jgi:hypothetical protein
MSSAFVLNQEPMRVEVLDALCGWASICSFTDQIDLFRFVPYNLKLLISSATFIVRRHFFLFCTCAIFATPGNI